MAVGVGAAMTYEDWEATVPGPIRGDAVWTVKAYRSSLFLLELAWSDVTKLLNDRRTRDTADQLYRAIDSIGANLAEGYSRGSGKDQARFYEYALGSARESRHHYYGGRHILGEAVVRHRFMLLTEIIRLTITMVPDRRRARPVTRTH
jgi:four helix bundle protein